MGSTWKLLLIILQASMALAAPLRSAGDSGYTARQHIQMWVREAQAVSFEKEALETFFQRYFNDGAWFGSVFHKPWTGRRFEYAYFYNEHSDDVIFWSPHFRNFSTTRFGSGFIRMRNG